MRGAGSVQLNEGVAHVRHREPSRYRGGTHSKQIGVAHTQIEAESLKKVLRACSRDDPSTETWPMRATRWLCSDKVKPGCACLYAGTNIHKGTQRHKHTCACTRSRRLMKFCRASKQLTSRRSTLFQRILFPGVHPCPSPSYCCSCARANKQRATSGIGTEHVQLGGRACVTVSSYHTMPICLPVDVCPGFVSSTMRSAGTSRPPSCHALACMFSQPDRALTGAKGEMRASSGSRRGEAGVCLTRSLLLRCPTSIQSLGHACPAGSAWRSARPRPTHGSLSPAAPARAHQAHPCLYACVPGRA